MTNQLCIPAGDVSIDKFYSNLHLVLILINYDPKPEDRRTDIDKYRLVAQDYFSHEVVYDEFLPGDGKGAKIDNLRSNTLYRAFLTSFYKNDCGTHEQTFKFKTSSITVPSDVNKPPKALIENARHTDHYHQIEINWVVPDELEIEKVDYFLIKVVDMKTGGVSDIQNVDVSERHCYSNVFRHDTDDEITLSTVYKRENPGDYPIVVSDTYILPAKNSSILNELSLSSKDKELLTKAEIIKSYYTGNSNNPGQLNLNWDYQELEYDKYDFVCFEINMRPYGAATPGDSTIVPEPTTTGGNVYTKNPFVTNTLNLITRYKNRQSGQLVDLLDERAVPPL